MRRLAILTCVCIAVSFGALQVTSNEPSEVKNVHQLRQKYLGLVNEHVKSWSQEHLEHKIKEAESVKLLEQAKDILEQLTEEYPGTPSGTIAKELLNQLQVPPLSHLARRAAGFTRLHPSTHSAPADVLSPLVVPPPQTPSLSNSP